MIIADYNFHILFVFNISLFYIDPNLNWNIFYVIYWFSLVIHKFSLVTS